MMSTLAKRLNLTDSKYESSVPPNNKPMTPGWHATGIIPDLEPGDLIQIDPMAIPRTRLGIVIEVNNGGRSIGYAMPFSTKLEWIHVYHCHKVGRAVFWPDGTKVEDNIAHTAWGTIPIT